MLQNTGKKSRNATEKRKEKENAEHAGNEREKNGKSGQSGRVALSVMVLGDTEFKIARFRSSKCRQTSELGFGNPKGPKIEKIQDHPPGLKFSIEIENFKRATHQTPISCGEF